MTQILVMTVIGRDRPGLVESIAALVAEHGGNWLESRMARLGGQFAGILRVELPIEQHAAFTAGLDALRARGLNTMVQPDEAGRSRATGRLHLLEIVGQDRPGIVRQISAVLADYGVNVEELETECASAAMSGETLFKAHARVEVPVECDLRAIRAKLEKLAADLIVEISLDEVNKRPGA